VHDVDIIMCSVPASLEESSFLLNKTSNCLLRVLVCTKLYVLLTTGFLSQHSRGNRDWELRMGFIPAGIPGEEFLQTKKCSALGHQNGFRVLNSTIPLARFGIRAGLTHSIESKDFWDFPPECQGIEINGSGILSHMGNPM
jgi:hypothetical protein